MSVDTGNQFIVSGLDYLREVEFYTGKSFYAFAHHIYQLVFRLGRRPLRFRFQPNVEFVIADAFRITAQLGAANLGDHRFDFRKFAQSLFNLT